MKVALPILAGAAIFTDAVSAHYRWDKLVLNGQATQPYEYVRVNTNHNSPVTDVQSNDFRCNVGGLSSGSSTKTATVKAGDTVGFALDQATYHPGPTSIYLSKASGSAATYDGSGPWFKISEIGAQLAPGSITFQNIASHSFKIPSSTPPGEYLLRAEHIGLHGASSPGGAQFYISCAQLKIEGSGGGNPGPTISIPGTIKASDPGVQIGIYWPIPTSYDVPGPSVWQG
ncbi:hypothetical protein V493_04365 [Pseudogymnoascus sp. VKM F-4281 (FW-2241)]|nr:hypothetical protein V493_04365 [Pseudogymnoascus sp. VKM F-4281 (FW-2241)]